ASCPVAASTAPVRCQLAIRHPFMTVRLPPFAVLCSLLALAFVVSWLSAERSSVAQEAAPAKATGEKEPTEEKDERNLRLYERSAYDELRLRDGKTKEGQDKTVVVKIRPLGPPHVVNDELPKNITIKIQVRLIEKPDDPPYEVLRGKIIEWVRFRELILREAERLVDAGNFDEAFLYYEHLRANYKDRLPALAASTARYHMAEAKTYLAARPAQALALLNLAFETYPEAPGLAETMAAAIQKLFDTYLGEKKFAAARSLLAAFQQRFPQHAAAAKWRDQLSGEAQKLLEQAKAR